MCVRDDLKRQDLRCQILSLPCLPFHHAGNLNRGNTLAEQLLAASGLGHVKDWKVITQLRNEPQTKPNEPTKTQYRGTNWWRGLLQKCIYQTHKVNDASGVFRHHRQ